MAKVFYYNPDASTGSIDRHYFVSGHSHQYPYLAGNGWAQTINGVRVLVPGRLLDAAFPNHIVLDTESGEASWQTSSREWIPEDLLARFPPE